MQALNEETIGREVVQDNDRILSDNDLLALIGIGRATLWRWRRAGLFPTATKRGPRLNGTTNRTYREWLKNNAA